MIFIIKDVPILSGIPYSHPRTSEKTVIRSTRSTNTKTGCFICGTHPVDSCYLNPQSVVFNRGFSSILDLGKWLRVWSKPTKRLVTFVDHEILSKQSLFFYSYVWLGAGAIKTHQKVAYHTSRLKVFILGSFWTN